MTIVYIHGASATSESFSRIRDHIQKPDITIDYDSSNGFVNNLKNMKAHLEDVEKIFFVAHSLGGIYALHLADYFQHKVLGAVTLSTPYGGSREADFARYFLPFSRLMRDIGPMSEPMTRVRDLRFPTGKWTNVVTTKGQSPWIKEPNDGVVTIRSMRHREDFELVEVPFNHYEVVLSNHVVDIILDRIAKAL